MKLYEVVSRVLGAPYSPNGKTLNGFDCWGLLYYIATAMGKGQIFPTRYDNQITIDNYSDAVRTDPNLGNQIVTALFDQHNNDITPSYMMAGDYALLKDLRDRLIPCIYLGNETILAAFIGRDVATLKINMERVIRATRL